MTTGMPELGSKISLISKADIRYEGRLFTVDPQECTIALASVRSFGTEDRETQYPVPAQNQVYDYILFRGSDIKDIRVVNNVTHAQPLNDPAIMQLSVPPTMAGQQFQPHPVLGHMGQMGQFGGTYGALGPLGAMTMAPGMPMQAPPGGALRNSKPSELIIAETTTPSSVVLSPPVEPPRPSEHASVLDLIGGGTRSTTPASVSSRKSPTNDQGVQAGSSGGGGNKGDKKTVKPIQPPGQRNQQRNKSRDRRDSSRSKNDNQSQEHRQHQNQTQHANRQPNRNQHNQQGAQGGGLHQHQNQSGGGGGYHQQHQNQSGYHHNQSGGGYSGYQGNQQGGRGGWVNRGGPMRARGRPRGTFKPNQGQPHGSKKNTLKFDNDYDFEQANTEFEELKNKLAKVKLDDAAPPTKTTEVNGDVDKKDDSGNETGAGEPEQEEDQEVFYDKAKSFFDKISCEAVERAKGKCQRTDWRTERKLNSETFGVAATRRGGYYSYRGRGGFRGMGYRGAFRGGYRQQQYPQRRDNNQQQQSTPQPQQPQQQQQVTSQVVIGKEIVEFSYETTRSAVVVTDVVSEPIKEPLDGGKDSNVSKDLGEIVTESITTVVTTPKLVEDF